MHVSEKSETQRSACLGKFECPTNSQNFSFVHMCLQLFAQQQYLPIDQYVKV